MARPKEVKSDLKDLTPGKAGAAFPHDLEQTPKSRKNRKRKPQGARSGNAPTSVGRPARQLTGGRDRTERKRRARP